MAELRNEESGTVKGRGKEKIVVVFAVLLHAGLGNSVGTIKDFDPFIGEAALCHGPPCRIGIN